MRRKNSEFAEKNNLDVKVELDNTIKVLTRDWGNFIKRNFWKPLLHKITLMTQRCISFRWCSTKEEKHTSSRRHYIATFSVCQRLSLKADKMPH